MEPTHELFLVAWLYKRLTPRGKFTWKKLDPCHCVVGGPEVGHAAVRTIVSRVELQHGIAIQADVVLG